MTANRSIMVFVDTNYLYRAIKDGVDVRYRDTFSLSYPDVTKLIQKWVEERIEGKLIRQLWYDGFPGGVPTLQHRELMAVPGVRVRSGRSVTIGDGRQVQKGVDTLIVRDLVVNSFREAMTDMVLISGDADLIPGVDEVSDHGIMVHLWSVHEDNSSPWLEELADTKVNFKSEDFESAYTHVRYCPEPLTPFESGTLSIDQDDDASAPCPKPGPSVIDGVDDTTTVEEGKVKIPESVKSKRPSPAGLAAKHPHAEPARYIDVDSITTVKNLNSSQSTTVLYGSYDGGYSFGVGYAEVFWDGLNERERQNVVKMQTGGIPQHIDGHILRLASRYFSQISLEEQVKINIREGFVHYLNSQDR